MFKSSLMLAAIFASVFFALPGAAQEIGKVEERLPTENAVERNEDAFAFPDSLVPADGAIDADVPTALRDGPANAFTLTAVEIVGATAIPKAKFAPLYDNYLARTITVKEVILIVDAITAKYRDEGYFLSRATAPAQNAQNGVLRIDVAEGYLEAIEVSGDATPEIKKRLARLKDERPLRLATVERTLALIGDLKGVSVASSRIEPDPELLERHRLIVNIRQNKLEGSLYSDNRGTPAAGPIQAYARVAGNSLFKGGDQLSGSVFVVPDEPDELILGEIAYHFPLTSAGTYATFGVMASRYDAGANLAALEVESRTRRFSFSLSHPLIRQRKTALWINAGFEARDIEEERLGAPRYEDMLRVFFASASFQKQHWNGVTSVVGKASVGVDMLGDDGGMSLSRPDADRQFAKFTTQISRYQNVGKSFGLYASFSGQTSLDPLLSSEEFSLGGARFGRAYDYGELTGDDGMAMLAELRYGRKPDLSFLKFYQLYGFVDHGVVWNDNAAPGFERLSLSSAGGGIRLTFPQSVSASFDLARPIDRTPFNQSDRDWRGFFSLSKSF